ncbi:uncharacterized protein LOC125719998 isoform X2 [Brienomyrus brachyistius]|uniref:uncharacterized protein LOC125719998 isoform X2 n=1 Tax=Brienomyrus brachyistius TaxID=42636 RepID=UPI0020B2504D|nr:uncharacterized protein LOC125719998 isoform X2 [Brienomyrus brachyistius]
MGPYYLDGYAEIDGVRTAYEFAGCFFHGCPECFDSNTLNLVTKLRFGDMHQQFQDKIFALKHTYNLNVHVIWEHQWDKMKAENASVQAFLREFDFPERIDPRDALFGGRTNALQLHYKAEGDDRIDYYDFTSLYPSVNKFKEYPVGHPVVIYRDFDSVENYFGLIKAKVYPPRGLYLPVLPYRSGGKLMFTLCRTCCETETRGVCNHTDEQRALSGTWCSIEINKAVEKGYKIAKIYEVWHFPDRTDTLFADYINTHLKGKQEASGYPSWVKSAEDKERYIQTYFEKEGIRLNPENIGVNKVKRQISKLFLNSLWGKFGQRINQASTTLIKDPDEFLMFIFSKLVNVSHFSFLNDNVAMVQWRNIKGFPNMPRHVNTFIAAFTTAYARLELYNLMDRLGRRTLYHDTDSVIFVSKPGDWMPPLGDFLGELTSELDPDDHIVEFVSGGPKTYGYRTAKSKTNLKVKGITLHNTNSKVVNIASLTELVHDFVSNPRDPPREIRTSTQQILRDKRGFLLKTKTVNKCFKVVYTKRQLLPDYSTLPYGY